MRVPFALTGVMFGLTIWPVLFQNYGQFEPTEGVAFAFWGAISALALVGMIRPVTMLPLLVLQCAYKALWIGFVGAPLMSQPELHDPDLFNAMAVGVVLDVIAIPWLFSLERIFRR